MIHFGYISFKPFPTSLDNSLEKYTSLKFMNVLDFLVNDNFKTITPAMELLTLCRKEKD